LCCFFICFFKRKLIIVNMRSPIIILVSYKNYLQVLKKIKFLHIVEGLSGTVDQTCHIIQYRFHSAVYHSMQITRPPWKRRPFLTNDLNYERPSRCKDILRLYRYWLNIVNITPLRDNKTTRNYLYGFKQA
jgi:hypothetical protein